MYYHEAARKSRVSHLSKATKSQRDWVANQRDRVARKGVHSGLQPSEVATGAEPADTAQLATDGGTERHDPVPSDHACGMEYLAQAGVEAPLARGRIEVPPPRRAVARDHHDAAPRERLRDLAARPVRSLHQPVGPCDERHPRRALVVHGLRIIGRPRRSTPTERPAHPPTI